MVLFFVIVMSEFFLFFLPKILHWLNKEQEQICRQLGKLEGLQCTLGNKALILADRGELEEAIALQKETEGICRQLDRPEGVANSLINQALCFNKMDRVQEGLFLAKESHRLATQYGFANLASQIASILNLLRD